MVRVIWPALLALGAAPAIAQTAMPVPMEGVRNCPATPLAPPPIMAGWVDRGTATAAASVARIGTATLTVGKGADVALLATPDIHYPTQPERPGAGASYGGLLAFTVAQPSTYRVVIGSTAWVDVVRDGQVIASTAHAPAPPCTGARKMVDFSLAPGRYVLTIVGNKDATLPVLVTRVP